MKKILLIALFLPLVALAEGPDVDQAPDLANNTPALQRGAKLFVNYCLSCHSARMMRYNRLRDIGLSDDQIKQSLLLAGDKVGDTMTVAMQPADGKEWFGTAPPDLSVMARAKGADYIYTYLRTYYRDPTRPTGWNNLTYPNTAMPNPLWQLQGVRDVVYVDRPDPEHAGAKIHEFERFVTVSKGTLDSAAYDSAVADLTAYMDYMGEPARDDRHRIGGVVLIFLGFFTVICWRLNAAYWKNVK